VVTQATQEPRCYRCYSTSSSRFPFSSPAWRCWWVAPRPSGGCGERSTDSCTDISLISFAQLGASTGARSSRSWPAFWPPCSSLAASREAVFSCLKILCDMISCYNLCINLITFNFLLDNYFHVFTQTTQTTVS